MKYLTLIIAALRLACPALEAADASPPSPSQPDVRERQMLPPDDLAAWWSFDEGTAREQVSRTEDELSGNFKFMERGVRGQCLRFDGFTTLVRREAARAPRLAGAVTFSAWVAMGAYPWNWSPVVSQRRGNERGFDFGINYRGEFGLQVAVGGAWIEGISKQKLELRRWYHLAATYDPASGIRLYLDGQPAGETDCRGEITFAPETDLHLGRNHQKMLPVDRVREWARFPSWWAHDGMLDEVKIHRRAMTVDELVAACQAERPDHAPEIPARRFPDVAKAPRRFGAIPADLKFYEQWDALWQMAGRQDVVVGFDSSPAKMVFWRGTHYSPCWVTENGRWMADQSLETGVWPDKFEGIDDYQGAVGCSEHMSDTECRFAHVKIIENTPARVVVHWRYAMVDCALKFVEYDEVAGRGQWGDEFYYIYPDAVAARYVVAWWPERHEGADQETIFLSEPGTRPEDNCELEAVTLVGIGGESKSYSWEQGYPKFDVPEPVIQMVNLKAEHKPFMMLPPDSKVFVFGGEARKGYSHFPWWNHWPVARVHSDGRYAEAPDRAAHSSLSQTTSSCGSYLYGSTNQPATALLPLAKSWISPPGLQVSSAGFESLGYNRNERAYRLCRTEPGGSLELTLGGSTDSPVVNPAFVIEGWSEAEAVVHIDGKLVPVGKQARIGHNYHLDRSDLVVWLEHQASQPVRISVSPGP
ncbi:MAG: LamG domain-containing protein [Akkermansiaceae bacterium]|nr:LamG domain-containing protein [Akkermansiaceae bacterium]